MFLVIVDFNTTDPSRTNFPPTVNMEFDTDQVLEAANYYYVCLQYFQAAKKWDPEYHGLTIDCHFWSGNEHVRHITY